jgi:hypothetical protein
MNKTGQLFGAGFALAFMLTFALPNATHAAYRHSEGVTVWDENYKVVHVLNGHKEVSAMQSIWLKRKKIKSAKIVPRWKYKIDLPDSTRWLYDPRGYLQILSPQEQPLYKIPSVDEFNRLIGAQKDR